MTDDADFSMLLNRPESKTLDFKAKGYDTSSKRNKRAFAKDLASFANTPREGDAHIVLGVKKHVDGSFELLGLDKAIDDSDLQTIAGSILEPVPQFSYQPIRHCSVLLGLITIPPDQEYPSHQEGRTEKTSSKVAFTLGAGLGIPPRRHVNRNEYGIGFMVESVRTDSMNSFERRLNLPTIALMLMRCFWARYKRLASHLMPKRPGAW